MRKYLHCLAMIAALATFGHADDSATVASANVLKTLEHIMAKAGISIDGEFQSEFLSAEAGGSAVNYHRRTNETNEFTSVDFEIKARPNTVAQGRLIFRMQQNWENFYSSISNPIFTRWLSIDGSVAKNMFSYNVGDFKQKFTPLTLYTPDISVLYEPDLFAKQREIAENEVFLNDNDRLLQGVNVNFAAEVYPIFNSLKASILATRLRSDQTSIKNGSKVVGFIEDYPMDKYMAAGNLDMTFLKGVSLGGSYLNIFDLTESYSNNGGIHTGGDTTADTMAQNTRIADVRGGVDVGAFVNATNWKLNVSGEYALSGDDSSSYDTAGGNLKLKTATIDGNALRAEVKGGYSLSDIFSIGLNARFINNTSNFRNELAQSPDFFGRRIMDFENDNPATSTYNVTSPLYSTFDAMYQQVFKFAPGPANTFNSQISWWFIEPFSKNSYTPIVFTQSELATSRAIDTSAYYRHNYLKGRYLDPSVQLIMPFGPATPNRTGINGDATIGFLKDRLQAKVLFASLKEIDGAVIPGPLPASPARTLPKTAYSQIGAGLKADLGGFVGWRYPIRLSSSVVVSKASNSGLDDGMADDTLYPAASITSTFYSENLYFKFWKRLAVLGGMEMVINQFATANTKTQNQLLTAIGLEYKITEGSYVTGTVGQIDVTNKSDNTADKPGLMNFNQKLFSLFLKVLF